jgi:hypothetical protein
MKDYLFRKVEDPLTATVLPDCEKVVMLVKYVVNSRIRVVVAEMRLEELKVMAEFVVRSSQVGVGVRLSRKWCGLLRDAVGGKR